MADVYKRGIYLYINGQEIENNLKSITNESKKLTNEFARMTPGTQKYIDAAGKIRVLNGIIAEHRAQLKQTTSSWLNLKNAADKFNRYFGLVGSFIAGLTGMILGFKKAVEAANLFEERMGNLSALTGLTGKNLEWLGTNAKQSSIKITESGIRIKQSASDIVDAYTKMGSQRPELLKNKEALAAVTEDAIILAEAAKSELAPAVAALATTLNQFNARASESTRIINILASGSKEGAAEIPYLTEALEKSGTTANMMGMSIEQTVGMIEAIAPKFAEARVAGTGLDRVLMVMRKTNIGFKDGVFDMNRALDELRNRYKKGEQAVDLFGMEHAKMAEVMLQAQADYNKYTAAVTGSNVAIEQASINTNNNNAKLAQAKNRVDLLTMALGEKLAPAMTFSTNSFSYFLKAIMAAPEWIQRNRVLLIALAGAQLAYNGLAIKGIGISLMQTAVRIKDAVVLKALIIQEGIQTALTAAQTARTVELTVAQKVATVAQYLFNAAMKANPIGWVIAGITALVAAISYFSTHNKRAIAIETEKKAVIADATVKNAALSKSYKEISSQIDHLGNLSIQEKKDLQDKIDKTIELTQTEFDQLKARRDKLFAEASMLNWWQKLTRGADKEAELANKKGEKAVRDMDDALSKLFDTLDGMRKSKTDLGQILNAESLGDAIKTETITDLESKLQMYGTALKNVAINGEDYIRIQKKIGKVTEELSKARGASETGGAKYDKDKALADLTKAHIDRQNELKKQRAAGIIDQETYSNDLENEDIRYNNECIVRLTKAGQSIQEEQGKINDIMIKKQEDCEKEKEEKDKEYWKSVEDSVQEEMDLEDKKAKEAKEAAVQKRSDQMNLLAETQGSYNLQLQLLDEMLTKEDITEEEHAKRKLHIEKNLRDAKLKTLEDYGRAATELIDIVTQFNEAAKNRELKAAGDNDKKKQEIEKKYAKRQQTMAIAQAVIEGALEVARINSNAGVNADLTQTLRLILTGLAVARTVGTVALISSQQFAGGKYPVIGQDTGRTYQSAYVGPVRTGLYKGSSLGLFSEHEPEIVIDGPTTRRIQANYPGILSAIYSMKSNQYAGGKFPDLGTGGSMAGGDQENKAVLTAMVRSITRLNNRLDLGIPSEAVWVYSEFDKMKREVEGIKQKTTIS